MNIHLETERFYMRDIELSDVEDMFLLDSDPLVHKYLGNKPVKTKAQSEEMIVGIRDQYVANGIGRWAVIDKQSDEFLGWSGLKYEEGLRIGISYYDLGYRFKREFWGKGVATETAVASLKHGFEKMGLEKICGAADIAHGASNHILKKVGLEFKETFVFEGTTCNWYELEKEKFKSK